MNLESYLDKTNPLRRQAKGNQSEAETQALKQRTAMKHPQPPSPKQTWWQKFMESYTYPDIQNPSWRQVYERLTDPIFWGVTGARVARDAATGIYDMAKTVPYPEHSADAREFGITKFFREFVNPLINEIVTAKAYPDFEEGFLATPDHRRFALSNQVVDALSQKYQSEEAFKEALANRPNEVMEDVTAVVAPHLKAAGIANLPLAMGSVRHLARNHPTVWYRANRPAVIKDKRLIGAQLRRWDEDKSIYYSYSTSKDIHNPTWAEHSSRWTAAGMKRYLRDLDDPDEGMIYVIQRMEDYDMLVSAFEADDLFVRPKTDVRTITKEALAPPLQRKTTTLYTYEKNLIKHVRKEIGEEKLKRWADETNKETFITTDDVWFGIRRNPAEYPNRDIEPLEPHDVFVNFRNDVNNTIKEYLRSHVGWEYDPEFEIVAFRLRDRNQSWSDEYVEGYLNVREDKVDVIDAWRFNTMDIPRTNLATGEKVDWVQFDNWDRDPNVFYRLTNTARLDQQTSYDMGAADMMDRTIKKELRRRWTTSGPNRTDYKPKREYSAYLDEDGELMPLKDIKEKYGTKDTTKEHRYWKAYRDLADEIFNMKMAPPPPDFYFRSGLRNKHFVYQGVNAIEELKDSMAYRRELNWDAYAAQGGGRAVLQVFEGERVGEAYSGDGAVVIPIKTIGIFDLKTMK